MSPKCLWSPIATGDVWIVPGMASLASWRDPFAENLDIWVPVQLCDPRNDSLSEPQACNLPRPLLRVTCSPPKRTCVRL